VVDNVLFVDVFDAVMLTKALMNHRHMCLNVSGDMSNFIGKYGDSFTKWGPDNALLMEFLVVDVWSDWHGPRANNSSFWEGLENRCLRAPRSYKFGPGQRR